MHENVAWILKHFQIVYINTVKLKYFVYEEEYFYIFSLPSISSSESIEIFITCNYTKNSVSQIIASCRNFI
jgi:hypothetical protein